VLALRANKKGIRLFYCL